MIKDRYRTALTLKIFQVMRKNMITFIFFDVLGIFYNIMLEVI